MDQVSVVNAIYDRLALRRRLFSLVSHPLAHEARGTSFAAAWPGRKLIDDPGDGVLCLSDNQFDGVLSPENKSLLRRLIARCKGGWAWDPKLTLLSTDKICKHESEIYHFGLDPSLLKLAETYLQQPCFYLGPVLKLEKPDGNLVGTRNWHLDVEDTKIVRVLIYLSKVDEDSGPFEYLERTSSNRFRRTTAYTSGYISDQQLARLANYADPRTCEGDAGTAVIFDGANTLHRARPPKTCDRLSLTLTYVTRRPLQIFSESRLSWREHDVVCGAVTQRQRACIPPARLFD